MDMSSVKRNSEAHDELSMLPTGVGSITELAQDLAALKAGTPGSVARWACRPAVLRRVALMLAAGIPAEATRVIAVGEGGMAVAAAVALTAGLPFAVLGDNEVDFGEAHGSEDVALVATNHADLAAAVSWCHERRIQIVRAQAVFAPPGTASLFTRDEHGRIEEGVGA
jgi:hypothetical protein